MRPFNYVSGGWADWQFYSQRRRRWVECSALDAATFLGLGIPIRLV